MKRSNRMVLVGLALVGVIGVQPDAGAIIAAYASPVGTCGYPMEVGINGALCQGTYIGGGLVVTAAHCVDELSENPALIRFGDDLTSGQPEYEIDDVDCTPHASWDDIEQEGVDLAICNLEDNAPDVPIVYPMPPAGCEVAYLRTFLNPPLSDCASQTSPTCYDGIPGWEVSAGPTQEGTFGNGPKRKTDSVIVYQYDTLGSPYMLKTRVPGSSNQNMTSGDSGAPFYKKMPDGSWRLIGLHSARNAGIMYSQAVPPYYWWLENEYEPNDADYDILPCHTIGIGNKFIYDAGAPNCLGELTIAADDPNATWMTDCNNASDYGGGQSGCGGWPGGASPNDKTTPYLPPGDYNSVVASVQTQVNAHIIPCNLTAIKNAIIEGGQYYAGWIFLASNPPSSYVGLFPSAATNAQAIYNGCR